MFLHKLESQLLRLGFIYESIFRQAVVVKGRNRDNAWYSITDGEWPALAGAFERWLDPSNFKDGGQRRGLASLIADARGNATG